MVWLELGWGNTRLWVGVESIGDIGRVTTQVRVENRVRVVWVVLGSLPT